LSEETEIAAPEETNRLTDVWLPNIIDSLESAADYAIEFVTAISETSLTTIVISTFAAAFAGALGAQWIAEKTRKKNESLSEIRNTNATIMISFNIANLCITLKKDHVKSLKENFDNELARLLEFKEMRDRGLLQQDETFQYVADLKFLPLLDTPIDLLERQVFEKVPAQGRILSVAMTLVRTLQSLNKSLKDRNELIDYYQNNSMNNTEQVEFYFGLKGASNKLDRRYADTLETIYNYNDDCIFFAKILSEDLYKLGTQLSETYGDKNIKIHKSDFGKAEELGLMPSDSNYSDWYSMFNQTPPEDSPSKS